MKINDKDSKLEKFDKNQGVIIFGAGIIGDMIADFCLKHNIKISCFCDNNKNKIGTYIKQIPVCSLEMVKDDNKDPVFIISPQNKELRDQIKEQLSNVGFQNSYTTDEFARLCSEDMDLSEEEDTQSNYSPFNNDILSVNFVDFSITERCSLKCEQCGHLMQYYEQPKDCNKYDLFKYLDRIDEVFDVVESIHVLGGEPLVHSDFYEIVEYANSKETIKQVAVLTNGTIVPNRDKLQKIRKEKLFFIISEYKGVSKNIDALCDLLRELNISFSRNASEYWIACSTMEYQNHSIEELKNIYTWCGASNCFIVIDGKLFHCAFLGNTYRLKSIPSDVIQYIDLMDFSKPVDVLRKDVKQYLYGETYLKACNYCKGRTSTDLSYIPVAVQTKKPLPYKKYID